MFFQSQYEQAEPLCLDIPVCRIMNFSWNTKVSDTHTHTHYHTITVTELLSDSASLIWVYLFLKKANSAGMCTVLQRNSLHFNNVFLSQL